MNKAKSFYVSNKKMVLGAGIAVIIVICIGIAMYVNREQVEQLTTDYDVNVNTKVETDLAKYLKGVKHPDQVEVDWKLVDTTKVGTYEVILNYKGNEYKVTFHVRDMDAPTLKLAKKEFEFTLDTSVDDINKKINESITITDNYDKKFDSVKVVSELPKDAEEQTYTVSVKDQAGNESVKEQIKVTYTEPEEDEPEVPVQIETNQEGNSGKENYTPPVNTTPTPEPTPEPEPQVPVEQPPTEQPTQTDEFNYPANAIETFTTTDESAGDNWIKSLIPSKYDSSHVGICKGNYNNSVWYCWIQ